MTRPLPQLPLSLPSPPSVPPPTPTPAPAGRPQAFHLVHELPALLHHLLVHGPGRVGAEVVVVVMVVRLEGVLHEPDQAARARAPGAAAAPRPRALFHVAGHGPGSVGGPAAYAGSTRLRARERRAWGRGLTQPPPPPPAVLAEGGAATGRGSGRCWEGGSVRARPFRKREHGGGRSVPSLGKWAAPSVLGSDPSWATPTRATNPRKAAAKFPHRLPESPPPGAGQGTAMRNLRACALCRRSGAREGRGLTWSLRTRQKPSSPYSLWAVGWRSESGPLNYLGQVAIENLNIKSFPHSWQMRKLSLKLFASSYCERKWKVTSLPPGFKLLRSLDQEQECKCCRLFEPD